MGWRITGRPPKLDKFVVVGSPHTSAWDAPYAIAYFWMFGGPFHFMGKKELFDGPLGLVWRWAGGIPINRGAPQGLVQQMVREFERRERLWLMLAPKGTRAYREHWKTGFYVIAHAAKVPVVVGYADFKNKEIGLSQPYTLTGDVRADMAHIRAILKGKEGKHPERQSPVTLLAEQDEAARAQLLRVAQRASLPPPQ